jgi:hypothetical protein
VVPYTASIQDIERDFRDSGIPTSFPGFYNHAQFVAREQKNADYLNNYASFVRGKAYNEAYLIRASRIIPAATKAVFDELTRDGRHGACVDTSGVLSKALERHGIWNFVVKGSLTITYPVKAGIPPQYFYTLDTGHYTAPHAWLFAPPFFVVDATLRYQGCTPAELRHLPEFVLADSVQPAVATVKDLVSPEVRQYLLARGLSIADQISQYAHFMSIFSAAEFHFSGTSLKYFPCAVSAPDCELEDMIGLSSSPRKAIAIYNESIKPAIESAEAEARTALNPHG